MPKFVDRKVEQDVKENEDEYEDEYEEESADENQDEDPVEDTGVVPSSVSPVAGGEKEMGLFSRMIHFIHIEHRWVQTLLSFIIVFIVFFFIARSRAFWKDTAKAMEIELQNRVV